METFNHPEIQTGEVFFTNANARQFKLMRWTTKRKGSVAYDGEGNKLGHTNWFPIFLGQAELENVKADIQAERKTWREIMSQLNLESTYK